MNIWERIKRLWGTSSPPDHPLSEEERKQRPPDNVRDEIARSEADFASHGDPDVRGKLG